MSCLCESCRPLDPAPSYTEAHKRACLVMDIARTPTREARRERIARWRKRHGDASADALMNEVAGVFKELTASAAGVSPPGAGFDSVVSEEHTVPHENYTRLRTTRAGR